MVQETLRERISTGFDMDFPRFWTGFLMDLGLIFTAYLQIISELRHITSRQTITKLCKYSEGWCPSHSPNCYQSKDRTLKRGIAGIISKPTLSSTFCMCSRTYSSLNCRPFLDILLEISFTACFCFERYSALCDMFSAPKAKWNLFKHIAAIRINCLPGIID